MEENIKHKDDSQLDNHLNTEDSKMNNESLNSITDEDKNESKNEKEQIRNTHSDINNTETRENINSPSNNEKSKRHRRGKNETIAERTFKCPDCDKCYLSGPALVIHRKAKHGYSSEAEKKARGRPKKEDQQENIFQNLQIKYNEFFNNETRKKLDENEENINLDIVKDNMINIFRQCKNDIFSNINTVNDYSFYQLIINNWDNDNYEYPTECFSDSNKTETNKYNSPPLDHIFFLYLKEFSIKTNKNYFWFLNKFIVLFRECINNIKKLEVKEEYKTDKEKEYSQLYSAEGIPESCNEFFLDYMQPNEYYGLNEQELIELAQHFCFWLYCNKYTHSYLTLL